MTDFVRFRSRLDGFDRSLTTQRRTKEKNSRFNEKLLTPMRPRHSTFKYIGSRNRTIRRNRAYDWKSMIELRDAWFLVHRRSLLFLSHREFQESNIAVQFVLCILFSLRLNVARSTTTKFISNAIDRYFYYIRSCFIKVFFVKLKKKKIVCEIFDAIFTSHFDDGYFSTTYDFQNNTNLLFCELPV